ncbi:DUF4431 domain-containing protein [Janthinobacterium sp. RB2R34]|uniref:DUF4431 domain-containing protein n=1 Tax=Janthinobacterium sp. RB2R34 TaxID=3424193 RepID=UPI003F1E5F8E
MAIRLKLLSLLFISLLCSAAHAADCLKYEPDTVALSGTLHRATFPGRPNFESIADGDEAETGFYLTLAQAICTRDDGRSEHEAHKDVREIQLVLTPEQYAALRPQLGQQVQLRGQMFSNFTGHHHADVLLRVAP